MKNHTFEKTNLSSKFYFIVLFTIYTISTPTIVQAKEASPAFIELLKETKEAVLSYFAGFDSNTGVGTRWCQAAAIKKAVDVLSAEWADAAFKETVFIPILNGLETALGKSALTGIVTAKDLVKQYIESDGDPEKFVKNLTKYYLEKKRGENIEDIIKSEKGRKLYNDITKLSENLYKKMKSNSSSSSLRNEYYQTEPSAHCKSRINAVWYKQQKKMLIRITGNCGGKVVKIYSSGKYALGKFAVNFYSSVKLRIIRKGNSKGSPRLSAVFQYAKVDASRCKHSKEKFGNFIPLTALKGPVDYDSLLDKYSVKFTANSKIPSNVLAGKKITIDVSTHAIINRKRFVLFNAPVEILLNGKSIKVIKTNKKGRIQTDIVSSNVIGIDNITLRTKNIVSPAKNDETKYSVDVYDYVVEQYKKREITGWANGKDSVSLTLMLRKKFMGKKGNIYTLPVVDFKRDFDGVALQSNEYGVGISKTKTPDASHVLVFPDDSSGKFTVWISSKTPGRKVIVADLRGGRYNAKLKEVGKFLVNFSKLTPGLKLKWGSEMGKYIKNGHVVFPPTSVNSTKTYQLITQAYSIRNGTQVAVENIRLKYTISPINNLRIGGSLVRTNSKGIAMFNGKLPYIWRPAKGSNIIEISAEGSSNKLVATIEGISLSDKKSKKVSVNGCFSNTDTAIATKIYTDSFFSPLNWKLIKITHGAGGTTTTKRVRTGGNSGSYRKIVNVVTNNYENFSSISGVHLKTSAVYNPKLLGRISSINYSEDSIMFEGFGNGQTSGMALMQDGKYYLTGNLNANITKWTSQQLNCLRAKDFFLITNKKLLSFIDKSSHPDFSASGSKITFGFIRHNYTTGSGHKIVAGIDNWSVIVRPIADECSKKTAINNSKPNLRISSHFKGSSEGWKIVQSFYGGALKNPKQGSGYISGRDRKGHAAWQFVAPSKYKGDKKSFYNGCLEFDFRTNKVNGLWKMYAAFFSGSEVIIGYSNVKPSSQWKRYRIPINKCLPWKYRKNTKSTNGVASKEIMTKILGNVTNLYIDAEFSTASDDKASLRNVVLRSRCEK